MSCPGPRPCTGELSIRSSKAFVVRGSRSARHVTVGRKRFLLGAGARTTIVVRATDGARSLLRRRGSLRVKVSASKQGAFVKKVTEICRGNRRSRGRHHGSTARALSSSRIRRSSRPVRVEIA